MRVVGRLSLDDLTCGVCGGKHTQLPLKETKNSEALRQGFTHWTTCPETKEPFHVRVVVGLEASPLATLGWESAVRKIEAEQRLINGQQALLLKELEEFEAMAVDAGRWPRRDRGQQEAMQRQIDATALGASRFPRQGREEEPAPAGNEQEAAERP